MKKKKKTNPWTLKVAIRPSGVLLVILDSRRRIKDEKTLTVVFDCSSNGDRMRRRNGCELSNVERLVFDIFVGESGDKLVAHLRTHIGEERFPGMTITFALIQIVGKIAQRPSPSLYDGVDYERWSVFECVEFCKENRAVDPTTVECCPNVDFDDAEDTEDRVSTLTVWASREGWSPGVKFLLVQGGAEGTDERVLVLRTVHCRLRDERVASVEEGQDVERVTETMRACDDVSYDDEAREKDRWVRVRCCRMSSTLWRCHRPVHRQSSGHLRCAWEIATISQISILPRG